MPQATPEAKAEYEAAYEVWQRLHQVFLEGERLEPPQLKGLLNREARAKDRYDAAREALLGISRLPPRIARPERG